VTGDRARGVVLYASALVLLAGGLTWWLRAAPNTDPDPQIAAWSKIAEQRLPNVDDQVDADTVELTTSRDHTVVADAGTGEFLVALVCVAGSGSQVRVSLGDAATDSGRGVICSTTGPPDSFKVSTSDQLRLHVSVNAVSSVVFRYTLVRAIS
jgi:hypothetical protein